MAVYHLKSSQAPASVAASPYSGLPNHLIEERQDVIFRRVRGILNKITPETFDKLSKELVNVGLDSPRTLRGVIYLLFDKALKDLKYSSLYAKLCQELSEKAPNFEQEPGPNTFCKFLISKCEDEFERRRKATEDFDCKNELTDEEYEQKAIVKQKMLGNIKFICELGKKRLLQEEILHECIRGLLSKKKERPIQDQAQDLECLCQIMRTIGSLLDIKASKNLMNQYFERIDLFSKKSELPSRIRFMLRDVIDLRNNNWRPRPFQREDNVPQPLSKLREEAGYDANTNHSSLDKFGNTRSPMGISDLTRLHGTKLSMYLDDEPSFTTATDFHWGPSFLPIEHPFDIFSSSTMTTTAKATSAGVAKQSHAVFTSSANSAFTSIMQSTTTTAPSTTSTTTTNSVPQTNFHKPHPFQQHRDPFSRHEFGSARYDKNNKQQQPFKSIDSAIAAKPIGEIKRFLDDKAPQTANHPVNNFCNDRETNRHRLPPNIINPPPRMQQQQQHYRDFEQPFGSNSVTNQRRFVDIRQQPPTARGNGNISPNPKPPAILARRNVFNEQQQGLMNLSLQNPRVVQGGSNAAPSSFEVSDNRDRRFNQQRTQNFHQEINDSGPRQPKFNTSANYRPAVKNDRGLFMRGGDYIFDKPESELNFNWRTGPVGPAQAVTPVRDLSPRGMQNPNSPTQKGKNLLVESKTNDNGSDKPSNNNSLNNINSNQAPRDQSYQHNLFNNKSIDSTQDKLQLQMNRDLYPKPLAAIKLLDKEPSISSSGFNRNLQAPPVSSNAINSNVSNRYGEPKESQPVRPTSQVVHTSPTRPVIKNRSNELSSQQQQAQNARTANQNLSRGNQGDFQDRRDGPRRFYSSSHSQDYYEHRGEQRFRSADTHHHQHNQQESNHRPYFGRNQLDNAGIAEVDRIQNWRRAPNNSSSNTNSVNNNKDLNTSNNNNNISSNNSNQAKEQPSLLPSTIVPKPPTKITDTNFSLRPSHNLIGRVASVAPVQPTMKSSSSGLDIQEKQSEVKSVSKLPNNVQHNSGEATCVKGESQSSNLSDEHSSKKASEFHVNKFMSLISEFSYEPTPNVNRVAAKIKELKIPKSYQHECLVAAMKQSILKTELDRDNVRKLFIQVIPTIFDSSTLLNAFRIIFEQMHGLEVETPKVKSLVAEFLSQSILDGLLNLQEVSQVLAGGKHHPLFLLVLQKLEKNAGQSWLNEKFIDSKINLIDMLPEVDRSKDRLASILKDRCLGFLDPMLTIEPDLWEQMKGRDPSPAAIYRWIKENVDQTIQSTPTFAHVLISCLMRYIHRETMEKSKTLQDNTQQKQVENPEVSESSKCSPSLSSQNTAEIEKEMLTKFQQVLQAILVDKQMQLAILYALQSFFYGLDFPKGSLLRWFHMLYDMNIVDDDVFFTWKEEINDKFPGKGQALFQVNTWLNWLAEAESEEEEEGEEEEGEVEV